MIFGNRNKLAGIAAVLFCIAGSYQSNYAQSFIQNAVQSDKVLQPEVSQFSYKRAGSVDFRGDLNISIPLLTIPGRGGFDYPVALSYHSGIKTTQEATWVGLGWSLETGSVTRMVNFLPDFDSTRNGSIMRTNRFFEKDYPENSDTYMLTIPNVGSSGLVPMETTSNEFNASPPKFILEEWKEWKVDYSTSTFLSDREKYFEQFCVDDLCWEGDRICGSIYDQYGSLSTQDFFGVHNLVCSGYGYNSELLFKRQFKDIKEFVVTSEDGTRYVFGFWMLSEIELSRLVVQYVSTWRITAILSHDYVDVNSNGPDDPDLGNWIRFEYRYDYGDETAIKRPIRPLFLGPSFLFDNHFSLMTEVSYLSRIVTPTHEARFITSAREDISFLAPYSNQPDPDGTCMVGTWGEYGDQFSQAPPQTKLRYPLRLDKIELYTRNTNPDSLINYVTMEYAPKGQELCRFEADQSHPAIDEFRYPGIDTIDVNHIGKTTLRKVLFWNRDGSHCLPGYEMGYSNCNPNFYGNKETGSVYEIGPFQAVLNTEEFYPITIGEFARTRTGRMGYFYDPMNGAAFYDSSAYRTLGMSAWSLKTLKYPTGAVDTIEYERDVIHDIDGDRAHSWFTAGDTWTYFAPDECGIRVKSIKTYDPVTSTVDTTNYEYGEGHLPGLPISYLRRGGMDLGPGQSVFSIFDWSTNNVEYSSVTEVAPDRSRTKTHYFGCTDDNKAYYNQQAFHEIAVVGLGITFLDGNNRSWIRGKTKRVEYFNDLGSKVREDRFVYSHGVVDSNKIAFGAFRFGGESRRILLSSRQNVTYLSSDSIIESTYFEHNSNGLVVLTETFQDNGHVLKTSTIYMDSLSGMANIFRSKHILNAIETTDIRENDVLISSRKSSYSNFAVSPSDTQLYVQSETAWNDLNGNSTQDAGEEDTTVSVLDYDSFGNPLTIRDAHGSEIQLEWGSINASSRLTRRTKNGLSRSFTYNRSLLTETITDENGYTASYEYDDYGRLIRVRDVAGKIVKEIEYRLKY